MSNTSGDWLQLTSRVGGDRDIAQQQYQIIVASYTSRNRYYHNLVHVNTCLQLFTDIKQKLVDPDAVELAIWLHDIVYVPELQFNEQLSSAVAHSFILALTGKRQLAAAVSNLIMVTKHEGGSYEAGEDAKFFADIDLAILGFDREAFQKYETDIRNEYHYLQPNEYRKARISVLSNLLAQLYIYRTAVFRDRFEAVARTNIMWLVAKLDQ